MDWLIEIVSLYLFIGILVTGFQVKYLFFNCKTLNYFFFGVMFNPFIYPWTTIQIIMDKNNEKKK